VAWRRTTARVLPVDTDGRVLMLHGWDPSRPEDPFWFTIGGGVDGGETLPEAAVRELLEETGIVVPATALGEPIEVSDIVFTWGGVVFDQSQAFYAVDVPGDVVVSFDGQEELERSTVDKHGWLYPEDLEGGPERPADPELPRLMRLAVEAVRRAI
jgi:8-oxo-dGTP pyrophosphatase MutT (NUDIX family)